MTDSTAPTGRYVNVGAGVFTLDEDDDERLALSPTNNSHTYNNTNRPPPSTFNLELDGGILDGEDALLDWEQYSGLQRYRCFGLDITPVITALRLRCIPDWWYSRTKKERRSFITVCTCTSTFLLLLVLLILGAAYTHKLPHLGKNSSSSGDASPASSSSPASPQQQHGDEQEVGDPTSWRLSPNITPSAYQLQLGVSMSPPYQVQGRVAIKLNITTQDGINSMTMHAGGMSVRDIRIYSPDAVKEMMDQYGWPLIGNSNNDGTGPPPPAPTAEDIDKIIASHLSTSSGVVGGDVPLVLPEVKAANIKPDDFHIHDDDQRLHIKLPVTIGGGRRNGKGEEVWLLASFNYTLRERLSGFYRSHYRDDNKDEDGGDDDGDGEEREHVIATTQFEANSARTAFPCFDEPGFKATFQVQIMTQGDPYHVLSNTAATQIRDYTIDSGNGVGGSGSGGEIQRKMWSFQPTPRMSTYLLAFIIGEFTTPKVKVVEGKEDQDIIISVTGLKGRSSALQYALVAAAEAAQAFLDAFHLEFPLDGIQLVAIPDFSAGAMENWGLITFRETRLLVTETTGVLGRRQVALTVAHELAHQWYGNLVTEKWWSELWLAEGFATYFEYYGATAAEPKGEYFQNFYTDILPAALDFDALEDSHPLSSCEGNIQGSDAIESLFDAISYEKGGSLLRMMRAWANRNLMRQPDGFEIPVPQIEASKDPFLFGLQVYLQQHQFSLVTAEALWTSMGPMLFPGLSTDDVLKRMHNWTYQKSYPLVRVTIDSEARVWLQQDGFTLNGLKECIPTTASDTGTTTELKQSPWWVPVAFITGETAAQGEEANTPGGIKWSELWGCRSDTPLTTLPSVPASDSSTTSTATAGNINPLSWVKINAHQFGLYRVQYSQPLWDALITAATRKRAIGSLGDDLMLLPGVDLAGLLEDSFALADIGEQPLRTFLDLLSTLSLRPYSEATPWQSAVGHVYSIDRRLGGGVGGGCRQEWRRWVRDSLLGEFLLGDSSGTKKPTFSFLNNKDAVRVSSSQQTNSYQLLRPLILSLAGHFNVAGVQQQAVDTLQSSLSKVNNTKKGHLPTVLVKAKDLDADVRAVIYHAAIQSGKVSAYDTVKQLYLSAADDASEREQTLRALGYRTGQAALEAALEFALSADVRAGDMKLLIASAAYHGGSSGDDNYELTGAEITWSWFAKNIDELFIKLGGDAEASNRLAGMAESIGRLLSDSKWIHKVDELWNKKNVHVQAKLSVGGGHASRIKESIEANDRWVKAHSEEVCTWLASQ